MSALIETLLKTERRLEELTGGEIDTVSDREGRTLLLQRSQEHLRQSDAAKQAAILNALPAHIALLDKDGVILAVNEAWRRFADANALRGPSDGIGVNYLTVCDRALGQDSDESPQAAAGIRSVLAGSAMRFSLEYPCHSPTEQRWFLMTVTPLADDALHGAVVMHLNITERKKVTDELRESDRRFSDMMGNVDLVSIVIDTESRIIYCNDYFLSLTGWRREELLGEKFVDLIIPLDLADEVREVHSTMLAYLPAARHHENEILTRSGERRLIRWNNSVLRSHSGEVIGTASIGEDITERKRVEDEVHRLNADLEHKVKVRTGELEAANRELEAFGYSISHDLKAPIRHVEGFSTILREEYGDKLDARGRDYLQKMQNAGERMGQLVDDLLALSLISRSELNRKEIDLSALVQFVFDGLQTAEPGRDVVCIVESGLSANADRGLLRIVLENLISNACKFTARRIGAKVEFGGVAGDGGTVFFVRDNGVGFDAAYADKLFAPFQRLHSQSDFAGTGIGLSTVRRIITRHGGKVWAEGVVSQGATFHFTLPS